MEQLTPLAMLGTIAVYLTHVKPTFRYTLRGLHHSHARLALAVAVCLRCCIRLVGALFFTVAANVTTY